jgi:putative ABC transport system permease protein
MDGMGWELGEELNVEIDGQPLEVTLVGWYRETEDTGEVLQIRMEDYERVHPDVPPGYAVTGTAGTTPQTVAASLTDAFGETARVVVNQPDADQLRPFTVALSVMTALIGSVALAHIIAAAVTASRERARRLGILRAVGVDNRGLVTEVASYATVVALAGIAVGLALGWVAQQALGDLLTTALGAGPGLTIGPSAAQVVVAAAAVLSLGVAAAVTASLPVLRRPTHELVRAE